jgi:hypothetical protein
MLREIRCDDWRWMGWNWLLIVPKGSFVKWQTVHSDSARDEGRDIDMKPVDISVIRYHKYDTVKSTEEAARGGSGSKPDFPRSSSVSTVTRLRAGRPRFYCRHGQGNLLFAKASRLVLHPTQPAIQWVKRRGAIPSLPHTSLCHGT